MESRLGVPASPGNLSPSDIVLLVPVARGVPSSSCAAKRSHGLRTLAGGDIGCARSSASVEGGSS